MTERVTRRSLLIAGLPIGAFALACGSPVAQAAMYPRALSASDVIEDDEAAVLVGNAGPQTIDYLQFTHSSFPAINARSISLGSGTVVAVPVPIGTKGLTLSSFTTTNRPGGYLFNGSATGYIAIHTPPIDITAHGLYYVATVIPNGNPNYATKPEASMLTRFSTSHPKLRRLRAINFGWPGHKSQATRRPSP